jgi:hypothetical protein
VAHLGFVGQGEEVGIDLVLGQGAERQRRHELRARPRQDRAHANAGLAQQARQLQRLVGRDAAAHDQENPLLVQGLETLPNVASM